MGSDATWPENDPPWPTGKVDSSEKPGVADIERANSEVPQPEYYCTICDGLAEWIPAENAWRHKGDPFDTRYMEQGFCDRYGYPINVRRMPVSDQIAKLVATNIELREAVAARDKIIRELRRKVWVLKT